MLRKKLLYLMAGGGAKMTELEKIGEEIKEAIERNQCVASEVRSNSAKLCTLYEIVKNLAKKNEEKEEVCVGDVVILEDGKQAIVLNVFTNGLTIAYVDDCNTIITMYAHKDQVKLTGKHYDEIASVFASIGDVKEDDVTNRNPIDIAVDKAKEEQGFRVGDVVKVVNRDIYDKINGMLGLVVSVFDKALSVLYRDSDGAAHLMHIGKEVVKKTGTHYESLSEIIPCFVAKEEQKWQRWN